MFCQIVAGERAADVVEQDEEMVVFTDKFPSAPTHLLCVSKVHGEEFANVEMDKFMRMLTRVRKIIKDRGLDTKSYRISVNGAKATMVHDHLHIHILGDISHERLV